MHEYHTAMITVVVHTPLNLDSIAGSVRDDWLRAPAWPRLVVVDAYACVIAARPASAHLGSVKVRPSSYWFQNSALRAGIDSSLSFYQQRSKYWVGRYARKWDVPER